jgi:hypothetical protein
LSEGSVTLICKGCFSRVEAVRQLVNAQAPGCGGRLFRFSPDRFDRVV